MPCLGNQSMTSGHGGGDRVSERSVTLKFAKKTKQLLVSDMMEDKKEEQFDKAIKALKVKDGLAPTYLPIRWYESDTLGFVSFECMAEFQRLPTRVR